MKLDRPLVDTELGGDLLVQPSTHDMSKHLALSSRENIQAGAQVLQPSEFFTLSGIAGEGAPYRFQNVLLRRCFREEVLCAMSHRTHRSRNIALPGEEDHGQRESGPRKRLLQVQPISPGIRRSAMTHPGVSVRWLRNSCPEEKVLTE